MESQQGFLLPRVLSVEPRCLSVKIFFWLCWNEISGKSYPQKTNIKLDKTDTNDHSRVLETDPKAYNNLRTIMLKKLLTFGYQEWEPVRLCPEVAPSSPRLAECGALLGQARL